MKLPFFSRRLTEQAFAERVVRELTGRAPDLESRVTADLSLNVAGRGAQQSVRLDNAFAQYQAKPDDLEEILDRWCGFLISGFDRGQAIDLDAVVPVVKGSSWIEQQRQHHLEQFRDNSTFDIFWEPYNAALVVVYAEFRDGLRFVHSADLKRRGIDLPTLKERALANLRVRTKDWRATGGGDQVFVICADGNLEPSLILLDEVGEAPRLRVDGTRLVTVAERGFTISAGSANAVHVWQMVEDAAESFAKAQYPVSRQLFERRGGRFEFVDDGVADTSHPIVDPDNLDIHAVKHGGGSDLVLLISSPLQDDPRSIYRLFQKLDSYLRFLAADSTVQACGPPSPESTRIIVQIHPDSDEAVMDLLQRIGPWVQGRGASLVVELLA